MFHVFLILGVTISYKEVVVCFSFICGIRKYEHKVDNHTTGFVATCTVALCIHFSVLLQCSRRLILCLIVSGIIFGIFSVLLP